jgi:hypothetical protein
MEKHLLKKSLAFAVIVLFIGVSFQPVFAVDIKPLEKINSLKDTVNITVKICKTENIEEYSFVISKQKSIELDNLIGEFKYRLNCSKTIEENLDIFNEMIFALYDLGLLSDNVDVNELKSLVSNDLNKKFYFDSVDNQQGYSDENISNIFCLVSGQSDLSFSIPVFGRASNSFFIFYTIFLIICCKMGFINESKLDDKLSSAFITISSINILFLIPKLVEIPFGVSNCITFGEYCADPYYGQYNPSYGWIYTFGLLGKKTLEGAFFGHFLPYCAFICLLYIGISGFTGIMIEKNANPFYFGYASIVNIGQSIPS